MLAMFQKENRGSNLTKERVDPFSVLDDEKIYERKDYDEPMMQPFGKIQFEI